MSLMRAFTTRRNKAEDALKNFHIGRAVSQRTGKSVQRNLISSPLELVSTTNMLSYEAPDIAGTKRIDIRQISSSVSDGSVSGEESDVGASSVNTDETATDASSVEQSAPTTPEPRENHLSCYFKPAVDTQSPNSSPSTSARASFDAPAIPQRMPSHSKKAHERLHRQRSIQRIMSPVRRSSSEFAADQSNGQDDEPPRESPFGSELAQLDEVVEEFGQAVIDAEDHSDRLMIETLSLAVFCAQEYQTEIAGDLFRAFHDETPIWI